VALLRDEEQLTALCGVAAEQLGLPAAVVEKDYWVAQALRGLQSSYSDQFIFKGGTSLSKAYGLIERFSEDIDILIIEHEGESGSARYKRVKAMSQAAGSAVGDEETELRERTGLYRTSLLRYGQELEVPALMLPQIRLDMGFAGGIEPHEPRVIGTLLGDVLTDQQQVDQSAYEDLAPFSVPVLHPGRTLIEKLLLIHTAATRSADDPSQFAGYRAGRHFYDVHCLLGSELATSVLTDRTRFATVLDDAVRISEEHFDGVSERPENGFADSTAFCAEGELRQTLADEYERTLDIFYFGNDPYPRFDAVCERVNDQRDLL
jgi:Nucleotidyl transferase AbiEii toxin, Type IV TA system